MALSETCISQWIRILILASLYGVLLAGGNIGSGFLVEHFQDDFAASLEAHETHILMAGIFLFGVFLAIPFVPGIEISLALLAIFGSKVVIAVYAATVLALCLSWWVGSFLSLQIIVRLFTAIGFQRAQKLATSLAPLNAEQRLERLVEHAPKRIVPVMLKHRYIAVICALNIPGNAIVGGGGGIALLAGMTGLFKFPLFFAAVSLAALPVPLFILIVDR